MLDEGLDADGFRERTGVSRETLARYETWRSMLEERNAVMNLVGRSTLPDFWHRHASVLLLAKFFQICLVSKGAVQICAQPTNL